MHVLDICFSDIRSEIKWSSFRLLWMVPFAPKYFRAMDFTVSNSRILGRKLFLENILLFRFVHIFKYSSYKLLNILFNGWPPHNFMHQQPWSFGDFSCFNSRGTSQTHTWIEPPSFPKLPGLILHMRNFPGFEWDLNSQLCAARDY